MCFNLQPEDCRDFSLTIKNGEKSLRKSLSQIEGCLLNLDKVLWTDVDASIDNQIDFCSEDMYLKRHSEIRSKIHKKV